MKFQIIVKLIKMEYLKNQGTFFDKYSTKSKN